MRVQPLLALSFSRFLIRNSRCPGLPFSTSFLLTFTYPSGDSVGSALVLASNVGSFDVIGRYLGVGSHETGSAHRNSVTLVVMSAGVVTIIPSRTEAEQ